MGSILPMSSNISDVMSQLSAISAVTPVNWDAFDTILRKLDNINRYDKMLEETLLSEFLMYGDFYSSGVILADVVRHFLLCGYDVSANEGANGELALSALCWSSYDQQILAAAKVLLNAGATIKRNIQDTDSKEAQEDVIESITMKLGIAWMEDEDFAYANTLEAYYAMAYASLEGKDYNSIDSYFACIGKSLDSVSAISVDGYPAIQMEGSVSIYNEPLILWFEDTPLIASCYNDFVVNPVYADEKKDALADISGLFSSVIGARLNAVRYVEMSNCCFEFSNGKHLSFMSRDIGEGNQVGSFGIAPDSKKAESE